MVCPVNVYLEVSSICSEQLVNVNAQRHTKAAIFILSVFISYRVAFMIVMQRYAFFSVAQNFIC